MSRIPRLATRALSVSAAFALGMSLTACTAEQTPSADSTGSASASASPSASPSPTAPSPEEEAISKAETALHEYFRVSDVSMQDPENFRVEDYKKVAISSALIELQNGYNSQVAQDVRQIGGLVVDSVEDPKVDLTFKPKKTPPEIPNVIFTVCFDVSAVNVVDKDGKSIVPPGRPDRGMLRVGVANYEYPDGPWLVDFTEGLDDKSC